MSARIGTNGFGRIGRDHLRYVLEAEDPGQPVKVVGWYDDEWGCTARLVDLTRLVAAQG